ncbi:hypothetical protein QG37_01170 [Candidozyma auris]|nr:hypothetical protein QG37_01170 [[Candida] auris]
MLRWNSKGWEESGGRPLAGVQPVACRTEQEWVKLSNEKSGILIIEY